MSIFFDSRQLPQATPEYVVWLDVMGIGPTMGRSVDQAANFIFKFHVAACQNTKPLMHLYPVMDGLYATSPDQDEMLDFLAEVFDACAGEFLATPQADFQHRFLPRGALSFGPTIHGSALSPNATQPGWGPVISFSSNVQYKASILIGLPMILAHGTEKLAPPFGLYVHESARSFCPPKCQPIHFRWWKWGMRTIAGHAPANWTGLSVEVADYFQRCHDNSYAIEYDECRIATHKEMAAQYFR
jgi:hypothetical protein